MKRGMSLLVAAALLLAVVASSASASPSAKFPKLFPFQSPSGNIGCILDKKSVRCDIREHTWPTPPQPANCEGENRSGAALDQHGRASFICANDTALDDSAPVLDYGDRISKGNIRCASKTKGMRCVNLDTKDGFFLSREVVHLF
jgi:hypothetical protein